MLYAGKETANIWPSMRSTWAAGTCLQANIFMVDMEFLGDTRSAEELPVFTNVAPERLCLGCGLRVEGARTGVSCGNTRSRKWHILGKVSLWKNWRNRGNNASTWMIVVLAKQIGWMLSLCKSVVEDMYLQRLEIVTPTWLRIGWTYVGLTLSLLSPTWSCLLDLRR